jgi:protocatechuate 4,5-dioxygenase alpha chain
MRLTKMCYSFNHAENRSAFLQDEAAYCAKFGLSDAQRLAVKRRNILDMLQAGGGIYYLAKLAGIFGLNVQDIGAQQTGMSIEAFKSALCPQGNRYGPHRRRDYDIPRAGDWRGHCPRAAARAILEAVL